MRFRLYVFNNVKEMKKIVLSSDEIKKCLIQYIPDADDRDVRTSGRIEVNITGKILREIKEDVFAKMDNLNNSWEKSKNSDISTKVSAILAIKYGEAGIASINDIVKGNKENIYGLREWRVGTEDEYREILIERIGADDEPETFELENMFVHYFSEEGGASEGNGEFNLVLRQRINRNNKNEYKY